MAKHDIGNRTDSFYPQRTAGQTGIVRQWLWLDVAKTDLTFGRLASAIAFHLMGKHKPHYTSNTDVGDYVVVTSCQALKVTGNKREKPYYRHTHHPGGLKTTTMGKRLDHDPAQLLRDAVRRMLPKGPLGRDMLRKLKAYSHAEHQHQAQSLVPFPLNEER